MPLQGTVPQLRLDSIEDDARRHIGDFRDQLDSWGFMALEVPRIGSRVEELYDEFSAALDSQSPRLSAFGVATTPQASSGGNHGFFTYGSKVPRLAKGTPDPKEFLHVSGGHAGRRTARCGRAA